MEDFPSNSEVLQVSKGASQLESQGGMAEIFALFCLLLTRQDGESSLSGEQSGRLLGAAPITERDQVSAKSFDSLYVGLSPPCRCQELLVPSAQARPSGFQALSLIQQGLHM